MWRTARNIETKHRDIYFQFVRGICMVVVVLIHSKASNATDGWELGYWLFMRQMTNFAVATFVFMAGYFAKPYILCGGGVQRLIRLGIPYILWSIFYCFSNGEINLLNIGAKILQGTASVQLYYMVILIELTIITPALWISIESRVVNISILLLTPLYLLVVSFLQYSNGVSLPWKGRDFVAWIAFYYLGMLVRHYNWKVRMSISKSVVCVIVSFLLSFAEGCFVYRSFHNSGLAISQIKLSSFIFALSVINLFMKLHDKVQIEDSNWLVKVGNVSFGIYFMHPFVIRCEEFLINYIGMSASIPLPVYHVGQTLFTVCICYMIIGGIDFADKKRKVSWLIGV